MDQRRLNRTMIDPKVRQVGFITPGAHPTSPSRANSVTTAVSSVMSPPGDLSAASSLSPVMIPPPRHNSIPVPISFSPFRKENLQFTIGSCNPSESLASPSWSSRMHPSEFGDDDVAVSLGGRGGVGMGASSLPGSSGEMMMAALKSAPALATVKRALTASSVVKMLPEKDGEALIETQNEVVGSSKLLKQKSSRADRRALQEAQRAAKAAAKEAGEGSKNPAASGAPKQGKAVKPPSQKKDVTQIAATAASEKKPSDRFLEKDRKKDAPLPRMQYDDKHRVQKAKRRAVVNHFEARNRVELFIHLPQYEHGTQLPDLESKFFQLEPMHPSMYKL